MKESLKKKIEDFIFARSTMNWTVHSTLTRYFPNANKKTKKRKKQGNKLLIEIKSVT